MHTYHVYYMDLLDPKTNRIWLWSLRWVRKLKNYVPVLDKVEKYGKVLVEILKGSLFYTT